ncbi:Short-chain dehydrogenase TIC 32, chloroplastic [Exophiala dermatitidis]
MKDFNHDSTGEEVVNEFADRVEGKTIVITGASVNGLGAETAISLAHGNPAHLILLARSQSRVDPVISKIAEINPQIKATFVPVSLDDFDSARTAAQTISNAVDKIDILINNAGVMALNEYTTNKNGIESQLATNHLGHFVFTNYLLPKILAAGPGARIVNLSSLGHTLSPFRFDDYNFSNGATYDPWTAYGQSKTANILFSVSLADKLREKHVAVYAVHPGNIYTTNLGSHLQGDFIALIDQLKDISRKNTGREFPINTETPKSPEQGVSTTLVAALDPRIEDKSGSYLVDGNVVEPYEYASDKENAERLWKLSEQLVGEKFEI